MAVTIWAVLERVKVEVIGGGVDVDVGVKADVSAMLAMVTSVGEGSIGEISEVRIRGVLTVGAVTASVIQVRVGVLTISVVVPVSELVVQHVDRGISDGSGLSNHWSISKSVTLQVSKVLVAAEVKVQEVKTSLSVVVVGEVAVLDEEAGVSVVVAQVDCDGRSGEKSSLEFHLFIYQKKQASLPF